MAYINPHTVQDLFDEIDRQEKKSIGGCAFISQHWRGLHHHRAQYTGFYVLSRAALKGRAFRVIDSNGKPAVFWLDEAQPMPRRGWAKVRFFQLPAPGFR